MIRLDRTIGAAGVLCAALLSACAVAPADPAGGTKAVVAPYPPPPKRAEIPPPAPSTDSLWQCGHWAWQGIRYVWVHGSYIQRPQPTANWMPGYWEQDPRGWMWTDGHWES